MNEGGTLTLRCANNVPYNVGTTEIFNPDGVSVAPVTYEVEDVSRDKAGNYSCVVTAVILPNTTRTVLTTVTIRCKLLWSEVQCVVEVMELSGLTHTHMHTHTVLVYCAMYMHVVYLM